jgi:hypothetical protein
MYFPSGNIRYASPLVSLPGSARPTGENTGVFLFGGEVDFIRSN